MYVVVQCIDGEVAAEGIAHQIAECMITYDQPLVIGFQVVVFGLAEGGYFNDLPAVANMRNGKPAPDQARSAEQLANFRWRGIGGDIEVFRHHFAQ